jgi:hypothetical protein
MAIIAAAVIMVGILCLVDLLLTFGVIRRLREQTALLGSRDGDTAVMRLAGGQVPGSFTAVTPEGDTLTGPAGFRLAAFFSSSCPICPRRVPAFLEYLRANEVAQHAVLAVVLAEPGDSVPYLDRLAEVATLCVQSADGELATAFKVVAYPAFCLLDGDGAVRAISYDPAELPEFAAA